MIAGELRRNDPAQYDELAGEWWRPSGEFAALHWLAASRAEHIPPASSPEAVLVDLACGGGLMAPHVARLGYRHVGVDIGLPGLELARAHGVQPVRGSVLAVPLTDGCADVVLAGEILAAADTLGLDLHLVGLRPSLRDAVAWRLGRRAGVRMKPIRSTAVVFAGYGRKR